MVSSTAPTVPDLEPHLKPEIQRPRPTRPVPTAATTAATAASNRLRSPGLSSPVLYRQKWSEAQLASLRPQTSRSPFGMLSITKSPTEIIKELAVNRGLTAFQAELLEDKPADDLVVGPFLLEETLGDGSWGPVFLASRMSSGQLVSLRRLPSTLVGEIKLLQQLIVDVNKISSKYIQRPIECGIDRDQPYMASEYITGEDLQSLVRRGGPLSPQQAIYCVARLVESLDAANNADLSHLELRPSKVFINREGELHLRDLALANLISRRKREETKYLRLMNVLPADHLQFIAPELMIKNTEPDIRSDMYSVGAILFFLLTGRYVYEEEDPTRLVMEHRAAPIPILQLIDETLPEMLNECLRRTLAKRPADRYASYAELHLTLQQAYKSVGGGLPTIRLWQGLEEISDPNSLKRPPIQRIDYKRAIVGASTAVGAVGAALLGIHLLTAESEQAEPLNPPSRVVESKPKGPTVIDDVEINEIPVVESVDSFKLK